MRDWLRDDWLSTHWVLLLMTPLSGRDWDWAWDCRSRCLVDVVRRFHKINWGMRVLSIDVLESHRRLGRDWLVGNPLQAWDWGSNRVHGAVSIMTRLRVCGRRKGYIVPALVTLMTWVLALLVLQEDSKSVLVSIANTTSWLMPLPCLRLQYL